MTLSDASKKWWALIGVSLLGFVGFIDFTIVNTALPSIQRELNATVLQLQWMMNVVSLALAVLMVTMGRLGDIFGQRLMLYTGVVLFGVSSVGAGLSPNPEWLIFFRALQGISAAIVFPCSGALVSYSFPENERGRALGIYTSITGAGLALGPVLGGLIVSALSWRWIFFINIPIIIVGFFISSFSVKESQTQKGLKVDLPGFVLVTLGTSCLVVGLLQGPDWGWGSSKILVLFAVSVISLVLLYFVEVRSSSPIINFDFFKIRNFSASVIACVTFGAFAWLGFFLMPLYLQNIRNEVPYVMGFMLLPVTAMIVILSPFAGRMADSVGAKVPICIGLASYTGSAFVQALFAPDTNLWVVLIGFLLMGIGWGLVSGPTVTAAISALPANAAGAATGFSWTLLNLASAIGLAVGGVIFRHTEKVSLLRGLAAEKIELTENQLHLIRSLLSDPDHARDILSQFTSVAAHKILPIFESSFMKGYGSAMWLLFGVSLVSFVLVLFMMKKPVKERMK